MMADALNSYFLKINKPEGNVLKSFTESVLLILCDE